MITAIVQFKVPEDLSVERAKKNFEEIAKTFLDTPGLVRKYFIISDDHIGGGVYLWETREQAEALYNGPVWSTRIRENYGVDPEITWFHCPVIAETALKEIRTSV